MSAFEENMNKLITISNKQIYSKLHYIQREQQQQSSSSDEDNFFAKNISDVPIRRVQSDDVQLQTKFRQKQQSQLSLNNQKNIIQLIRRKLVQIKKNQESAKIQSKKIQYFIQNQKMQNKNSNLYFQFKRKLKIIKQVKVLSSNKNIDGLQLMKRIQDLENNIKCFVYFQNLVKNNSKTKNQRLVQQLQQKIRKFNKGIINFKDRYSQIRKYMSLKKKQQSGKRQKKLLWDQMQVHSTSSDQSSENQIMDWQTVNNQSMKEKTQQFKITNIKLTDLKACQFQYKFEQLQDQQQQSSEQQLVLNISICSKSSLSFSKAKSRAAQNMDTFLEDRSYAKSNNYSPSNKIKAQTLILNNSYRDSDKQQNNFHTLKNERTKTLRSQVIANQEEMNNNHFKMTQSSINNTYQDYQKVEVYQRILSEPNIGIKQFFLEKRHLKIDQELKIQQKKVNAKNKYPSFHNSKRMMPTIKEDQEEELNSKYSKVQTVDTYPLIYSDPKNELKNDKKPQILKQNEINKYPMFRNSKKDENNHFQIEQTTEKQVKIEQKVAEQKPNIIRDKNVPQILDGKRQQIQKAPQEPFNIFQKLKPALQKNIFGSNQNACHKFGQQSNRFIQNNISNPNQNSNFSFNPNEMNFFMNRNQSFKSFGNIQGNTIINGSSNQQSNSNIFGNSSTNPLNVMANNVNNAMSGNVFMNTNMQNINPALLRPRK